MSYRSKLWSAIKNPKLFIGESRNVAEKINIMYDSVRHQDYGELIINKDWDNLLILDACRYDTFEEEYTSHRIDGDLFKFRSAASQSYEFMKKNFEGRQLYDTVYISANPFTPNLDPGIFHSLINLLDEWDESMQTVLPETVVEKAIEIEKEYPNKRLIIHFMQPHYPFIGETGKKIKHRGHGNGSEADTSQPNIWEVLQWRHKGYENVNEETVWEAYRENVNIAIKSATELSEELQGKTVLTADHGVHIGDRMRPIPARGYGHSPGLRTQEVTEVPWFVVEKNHRKEITEDIPDTTAYEEFDSVEERLKAFGYK